MSIEEYDRAVYEDDLAIDPDDLVEEWLKHPSMYFQYSELLSIAKRKMAIAHERIKVVRSELIKKAHKHPKKHLKGMKLTAPVVEAYYRDHEDHKEAKEDLINAEFDVSILEAAVWSFSHRKKALENLVQLLSLRYFAGPTSPQEVRGGKRIEDRAVRGEMNKPKTMRRRG